MAKKTYSFWWIIGLLLNTFYPCVKAAAEIPESVCFKDFNGNGVLDAGEYGECAATPQGRLCLLDSIQCSRAELAVICPSSASINGTADQCESPVRYRCPSSGAVSLTIDACRVNCTKPDTCEPFCPPDMFPQGEVCRSDPICSIGTYDSESDNCIRERCPYGDGYVCQENNGVKYCSASACMDPAEAIPGENWEEYDDNEDDGPRTYDRFCLGQIYIFSGKDRRCRSWGASIAFDNCCRSEDYLLGLLQCNANELNLAALKGDGLCHYAGEYCSKEIDVGFAEICVERSRSYCCFNSKLARIIQEQGRTQLSTFDGWGTASQPICRGLTPEEFQVLDFSRIDLSEWHGDIQTEFGSRIETNIQRGVADFYNRVGK